MIAWNRLVVARGTARSRRRTPPSARGSRRARRARRRSDASRRPAPSRARAPRRTTIRSSSSDRSASYSRAIRSTTGSSRFQASRGWTVVPRPCSTRTRPRSSRSFKPSRMTVRLKPNCSQSAGSVGQHVVRRRGSADDLRAPAPRRRPTAKRAGRRDHLPSRCSAHRLAGRRAGVHVQTSYVQLVGRTRTASETSLRMGERLEGPSTSPREPARPPAAGPAALQLSPHTVCRLRCDKARRSVRS